MLLPRILTAIALAVPVIWIILFQPAAVLLWLLLLVAFLSGLEWSRLAGVEQVAFRIAFFVGNVNSLDDGRVRPSICTNVY